MRKILERVSTSLLRKGGKDERRQKALKYAKHFRDRSWRSRAVRSSPPNGRERPR